VDGSGLRRLAHFISNRDRNGEVYVMNADGTGNGN
jgi:DNA phosphorothioation-dependent restriction protein DptG